MGSPVSSSTLSDINVSMKYPYFLVIEIPKRIYPHYRFHGAINPLMICFGYLFSRKHPDIEWMIFRHCPMGSYCIRECHVGVLTWRHQMEAFSALLAICAGNSPVPGEFHSQRPVTRSFDVFYYLRLNKRLSNNREAGDLRRHRAHYDVIVMCVSICLWVGI